MSWYTDCVNCGKQVLIESNDDICYWCGKPARVKVIEAVEVSAEIGQLDENSEKLKEVDMKRGGSNQAKHRFIEENKAEIIADLVSLGKKAMLGKWGISASGWVNLKKRWAADIETAGKAAPATVVVRKKSSIERNGPTSKPLDYKQLYCQLFEEYKGYRQAIQDVFGQGIEVNSKKE